MTERKRNIGIPITKFIQKQNLDEFIAQWPKDKIHYTHDHGAGLSCKLQEIYSEFEECIWDILWEVKGKQPILGFLASLPDAPEIIDSSSFKELAARIAVEFVCASMVAKWEGS